MQRGTPCDAATQLKLDRKRANAMHRELGKLGIKRDKHYTIAGKCLGRDVQSLTELTEAEAKEVWQVARAMQVGVGEPVSDAKARAVLN